MYLRRLYSHQILYTALKSVACCGEIAMAEAWVGGGAAGLGEADEGGWADGIVEEWYAKTDVGVREGQGEGEGREGSKTTPFMMCASPSWADFVVGGFLIWLCTIWGVESEKWQNIMTWHGGRWKTLMESLKKYETVV